MTLAAEYRAFKQFSLYCSSYTQAKSGFWKASLFLLMAALAKPAQAETFTSAEFLKWKLSSQKSYFRTSIGMAGLIAAQNDKAHAKCIENWYLDRERDATDFILETMKRFPSYHPRGVLLAVLEKQCGTFQYKKGD